MYEQKKIYVYDSFSYDTPILLGYLYVDFIKGKESYSFEYDGDYLKNSKALIPFDPDLSFFSSDEIRSALFSSYAFLTVFVIMSLLNDA